MIAIARRITHLVDIIEPVGFGFFIVMVNFFHRKIFEFFVVRHDDVGIRRK